MKVKNLFLVLAGGILAACSSSNDDWQEKPTSPLLASAPGTEVYLGVEKLGSHVKVNGFTRAAVNPLATIVNVDYFNVKVDPRLGYNVSASTYISAIKNGKLYTDCPFIDIYSGNDKTYLFSTDGTGLRTLIAAGDTTAASIKALVARNYKRSKPISPSVVEDNIHVIWYLSKYMNNGWHIDGLLTDKADIKEACDASRNEGYGEITFGRDGKQITYEQLVAYLPNIQNMKPLDKTLGVDIHQQDHKDWGEIKTSLHIKEAKDVTVTLPVSMDYTIENAETDKVVKYFSQEYEVQDFEKAVGANINVTVKRQAEGVTITVTGITDQLLKALERRYNDGLTVDIHSYYRLADDKGNGDYKATVWKMLKNSAVVYDGNVNGQITSAFNVTDKVEIKK